LEPLENGLCNAVLFDLDGTLVDTAPDMIAVLNDLQQAHELAPVPYEVGRQYVSNGALGLLHIGFPDVTHEFGSPLHTEYLERYARRICESSCVFPELLPLLDELDDARCPWGIVTNKPAHLTNPLLEMLSLAARSACTVSGDTLAARARVTRNYEHKGHLFVDVDVLVTRQDGTGLVYIDHTAIYRPRQVSQAA